MKNDLKRLDNVGEYNDTPVNTILVQEAVGMNELHLLEDCGFSTLSCT